MIEYYDECAMCGKWDDVFRWRNLYLICHDCTNYMIEHAPPIQGKYKCNNEDTFMMVKADKQLKESKNG